MRPYCHGFYPFTFSFGIRRRFSSRVQRSFSSCWPGLALAVTILTGFATQAHAISCLTESEMTNGQRAEFVRAMRALETPIQAGNTDGVKALTIAPVVANFDGIAQSVQGLSPLIQGGTFTVTSMYLLNASDVKPGTEETQFFCSVGASSMVVTITIPQLPAGEYLLALTHATGVDHPQQVSMILQQEATPNDAKGPGTWKLAGFFVRPMSLGGKEGLYYWMKAREYAHNKQNWGAYFYYQTAAFLLTPVDFLSSPNLEKLQKETEGVKPADLPGQSPMKIDAGGKSLEVTGLRTDSFGNDVDLIVNYRTQSTADPVATRSEIIDLMKALLTAHPELKTAFHGMWVYAEAAGQRPFAIEMAMGDIH